MKTTCRFAVAVFATLISVAAVEAQITGTLRGTVEDATGAVVPKASVKLTNLETQAARTQVAGDEGTFAFDLLSIGNYEVQVQAPGFGGEKAEVEVRTGEVSSMVFRLKVGQLNETVMVTDVVSRVDTENAQLQSSFRGQAIQELPVNRNPNNFVLAVPGVTPVSANNPFLGSGSFNSNGGRGRGNNIMIDGITSTDVSVTGTGGAIGPLNFSSIKEVKIITNNFSAEYGRNSSAQVLYITKGGTNDLHGELYEYLQNDKLNARSFFDRSGRADVIRQNTYGFEAGGPVFVPKVFNGKNRLFWHVDYEGFKKRGTGAARVAKVPTPAQFASITDPTALALAKQYQLPSSPTGDVTAAASNTSDTWQVSERADVVIGKNDTLWARYSVFDSLANSAGNTFINSNLAGFGAASANHPRQATLAETHLFGAKAVNEFRFGFGQHKPSFPLQTTFPLGPQINFGDGSVTSIGVSNALPQGREQRTYQYTDNVSLTHGSHTFKTGFEWYKLQADSFLDGNVRSTLTFATFADFAQGRASTYTQNFGNTLRENRVSNAFAFLQDDWKVNRKLTLNLGARLEFAGGPTEVNQRISNLNLDNRAAFGAAGAGALGLLETGKPSFASNYNWAPRLGFAWQPFGDNKTVIRGGFGISYDFVFLNPITNQRSLPPLVYSASLTSQTTITGGNSLANLVAGTADIQKVTAASVGQLSTTVRNFGTISPAIQQDLKNPQVQQRSFGVEREIADNLVLKVTYVGNKASYLQRTRPINLIANGPAPATSVADQTARLSQFTTAVAGLSGSTTAPSNRLDPRYNAVNYVESSAASTYNGLQVELQKRFHDHFFVNGAYSWSHSLDDGSDVLGVLVNDTAAQQNPNDNHNNHASSQFDVRHVLSISHTWEMPFFLHSSNHMVKTLLGGWAFSGISTMRTGFPVNIYAGATAGSMTDPVQYLGTGNAITRPNVSGPITTFEPRPAGSAGQPNGTVAVTGVPGVQLSTYAQSLGLSQPLVGNFGTLGRNVLRLNGQANFDWTLHKNFHLSEKANVQVRGEFYNVFNGRSFQSLSSQLITSTSFGQYNTVSQNARTVQLGARIVF